MNKATAMTQLPDNIEIVIFGWSNDHGRCYDCGLPAAFTRDNDPTDKLCAVCAANSAADGESIGRI